MDLELHARKFNLIQGIACYKVQDAEQAEQQTKLHIGVVEPIRHIY